jgi:hypothetical protein
LNKDDPEFDDSDDNVLTKRDIGLKRLDRTHGIGDGRDHREIGSVFPGQLNDTIQCWLFHDLYDHSYGIDQPALNLNDCLRIGSILGYVAVRHQATLNIESGFWTQPKTQISSH